MKIFRVIVPVADIEAAAKFYGKLFNVHGELVSPGRHYFDCEGVILACYDPRADGDGFDATPNPDHIYLSTDNLEGVYEKVKACDAQNVSTVETQPWGERSFYCKDPFGNPLCFVDSKTLFLGAQK